MRVEELEFNDPIVVRVGVDWCKGIACPWRLARDNMLVTSSEDASAEARLNELVASSIIDDHHASEQFVALPPQRDKTNRRQVFV